MSKVHLLDVKNGDCTVSHDVHDAHSCTARTQEPVLTSSTGGSESSTASNYFTLTSEIKGVDHILVLVTV